jgi:NADH-quinone oxidoreductase subunit J
MVFLYLAAVIVVTSAMVVTLRNPIHSVLSLLIMFFHVAGLYVTLHAEFLFVVQIMVYAGAILVLYLFVVMLLNVKQEWRYHPQVPVGVLLAFVLLTEVVLLIMYRKTPEVVAAPEVMNTLPPGIGNTEAIGQVLYTTYLFPFEVASLILLVAMIGAIILAKKDIFAK